MLLEDATSKEEVQAALDEGDTELLQDIEEKLDDAQRWFQQHGFSYYTESTEAADFKEVIDDSAFVDAVISESPTEYDLANVPRETVEKELRWSATHRHARRGNPMWGPFRFAEYGDRGVSYFYFKIATTITVSFPGSKLPENAEYIPQDLAEDFWGSLWGGSITWEQTSSVEENYGYAPGDDLFVVASEEDFDEWCRDVLSSHMNELLKNDEDGAIALFKAGVARENSSLAAKLETADLPRDEVLDFAAKWFEGDEQRAEVLETLKDYFVSMETGVDEPREIIGEWTQADLRAMGITKGPLYEEAPWKLIKLHPADLRLEGTLMRHCVGEKGMGYIKALSDGQIEIWSLRSQKNKPRFTLEVDSDFYEADEPGREGDDPVGTARLLRAHAIKQLKGKANRTPGFADKHETSGIKFPDEVTFWVNVLTELDVDPDAVEDFHAVNRMPEAPRRNPMGASCTGFDLPYRPRR